MSTKDTQTLPSYLWNFLATSTSGLANSDEFFEESRVPSRDADLRRCENAWKKSKITPEALPFPSTLRRVNAPPLRFVDGWATDASRRKIERNKKSARWGRSRTTIREKAKNRLILVEATSILFLLSAILRLSFSLLPLPLSDLLSGFVDVTGDYYYCLPSMRARMIRRISPFAISYLHVSFHISTPRLLRVKWTKGKLKFLETGYQREARFIQFKTDKLWYNECPNRLNT